MKTVIAIIVSYNSGIWLKQSVEAALKSEYPLNVYVVDNASPDGSQNSLKPLAGVNSNLHLIENAENIGFAKANNLILNTTDADYYVLINPDCMVQPETIGYLVNALGDDTQVGLAGVSILNEDGSPQKTSKRRFPTPENAFIRSIGLSPLFKNNTKYANFDYGDDDGNARQEKQYVDAISGAFMMVTKDALNHVGGLDEGYFMHCEDLDWCKRTWLYGYKVAYFAGIKVVHLKGKSSQTRPYKVNWYLHSGMLRFYRKFYRKHYNMFTSGAVYVAIFMRYALTNTRIFFSKILP